MLPQTFFNAVWLHQNTEYAEDVTSAIKKKLVHVKNSTSKPKIKFFKKHNRIQPPFNTMATIENNIATSLLSRAHSPDSTTRIFTEKIKSRPLLLKPSEPDNSQHHRRVERQRKLSARKKKLKPKPLSSRERRALGLFDIPKEALKYSIYEPLNQMWKGYIQEVLGPNSYPVTSGTAAKLCNCDFHGAEVEIVRSRCVSRVGVKGIVVKDSKFTFEIITPKDQVKIVPKEHTIFRFTVPQHKGEQEIPNEDGEKKPLKDLIFELNGDQFIIRATDRANRKFKPHYLPDL